MGKMPPTWETKEASHPTSQRAMRPYRPGSLVDSVDWLVDWLRSVWICQKVSTGYSLGCWEFLQPSKLHCGGSVVYFGQQPITST